MENKMDLVRSQMKGIMDRWANLNKMERKKIKVQRRGEKALKRKRKLIELFK